MALTWISGIVHLAWSYVPAGVDGMSWPVMFRAPGESRDLIAAATSNSSINEMGELKPIGVSLDGPDLTRIVSGRGPADHRPGGHVPHLGHS